MKQETSLFFVLFDCLQATNQSKYRNTKIPKIENPDFHHMHRNISQKEVYFRLWVRLFVDDLEAFISCIFYYYCVNIIEIEWRSDVKKTYNFV